MTVAHAARSYWRENLHTRTALASGTVAAVLDAIGDPDGDFRSAMESDGWGFEFDGNTIALTPPDAPNNRIILAGVDSGSHSPPMLSPDTFLAGILLTATVHRVTGGTFDWDASNAGYTVATGGGIFGYYRGLAPVNSTHIRVRWTGQAICIILDAGSNGTLKPAFLGGFGIPASLARNDDYGKAWGMSVAGSVATTGLSTLFWSVTSSNSVGANGLFVHGSANGNAHTSFRNPSDGTPISPVKAATGSQGSNDLKDGDNYFFESRSLITTEFAVIIEGIYPTADRQEEPVVAKGRLISDNSLVTAGFFSSSGFTNAQDTFFLEASNLALLKPAPPAP
jgi:hypothetical protein